MSDPNLQTQRQIQALEIGLERIRKADAGTGAGTAFPSTPGTGLLYFRTDLGWLCYYDGARWLTTFVQPAILATNPTSSTITNANLRTIVGHDQYAIYVVRCFYSFNVTAPNDGSNYWTIAFEGENANFSAATTIDSHATSGNGPGAWTTFDPTPATPALSLANSRHLNVNLTKTLGAPGAIQLILSMSYRLIVT